MCREGVWVQTSTGFSTQASRQVVRCEVPSSRSSSAAAVGTWSSRWIAIPGPARRTVAHTSHRCELPDTDLTSSHRVDRQTDHLQRLPRTHQPVCGSAAGGGATPASDAGPTQSLLPDLHRGGGRDGGPCRRVVDMVSAAVIPLASVGPGRTCCFAEVLGRPRFRVSANSYAFRLGRNWSSSQRQSGFYRCGTGESPWEWWGLG